MHKQGLKSKNRKKTASIDGKCVLENWIRVDSYRQPWIIEVDKDIEGFDLKMVKILRRNSSQEASIKQCKFECEVLYRSGCRGFVFDNKTCFLKSIGGPLIQHKGTITYVINDHRVDLHQLGWRMGSNDRNKFIHSFSGRKSGRGGSNNPFNIFPNGRKDHWRYFRT